MKNTKIITFNKENECSKQEGVSPDSIIYCGKIDGVLESDLIEAGLTRENFDDAINSAKSNDDCVMILS